MDQINGFSPAGLLAGVNVLDLLFLGILICSIVISARKGAFRAVAGLSGSVLGCLGAFSLMPRVEPFIYRLLLPTLRRTVEKAAEKSGVDSLLSSEMTQDVIAGFQSLLQALGLSEKAGEVTAAAQEAGSTMADAAAGALAGQIAPVVTFILLFILIKLAVSIILNILSLDIPVLRTINKGLGALLGACSGLVIVLVLCWGIARFASPLDVGVITRPMLEQSMIGGAYLRLLG